jgi:hypothetical protein
MLFSETFGILGASVLQADSPDIEIRPALLQSSLFPAELSL